jgi:choline-sulfatase
MVIDDTGRYMNISGATGFGKLGVTLLIGLVLLVSGVTSSWSSSYRPNIVIIVVDALRPDHLGCYGYERPTSPNIDRLAERGVLFDSAISQAPWTKASFASFLTSSYPYQHGVVGWESVMPESLITLQEVLAVHGYDTQAVINMYGIAGEYGITEGMDRVSAADKLEREAPETTDDALRLIKTARRPFFMLIHYFDVHWPYRPPEGHTDLVWRDKGADVSGSHLTRYREGFSKPSEEILTRDLMLYDACIRYVDDEIGKLVTFLDSTGLREQTLVVLTADHGEAFWEHGFGSHGANLYDEALRVPLVVAYPGLSGRSRRISTQVAMVDLLPTLVAVSGAHDEAHREGTSLIPLIEKGARSRNPAASLPAGMTLCESTLKRVPDTRCLRTDQWKLILEPTTMLTELYDLRSDPGETVNLAGRGLAVEDSLQVLLRHLAYSTRNGWRFCLTGQEPDMELAAQVHISNGSRLTSAERETLGKTLSIEVAEDSTSLKIQARHQRLYMVVFDVDPADADITVEITYAAENGPDSINVGTRGRRDLAAPISLEPEEAYGLPQGFAAARDSRSPALHLWWQPGEKPAGTGATTRLTTKAKKRLKALGYIQ